jgi:hypothetical protein
MILKSYIALIGIAFVVIGGKLLSASWNGAGFLAGFLLITGIQVFFWVIGIRLHLLGNVTNDDEWEQPLPETQSSTLNPAVDHKSS